MPLDLDFLNDWNKKKLVPPVLDDTISTSAETTLITTSDLDYLNDWRKKKNLPAYSYGLPEKMTQDVGEAVRFGQSESKLTELGMTSEQAKSIMEIDRARETYGKDSPEHKKAIESAGADLPERIKGFPFSIIHAVAGGLTISPGIRDKILKLFNPPEKVEEYKKKVEIPGFTPTVEFATSLVPMYKGIQGAEKLATKVIPALGKTTAGKIARAMGTGQAMGTTLGLLEGKSLPQSVKEGSFWAFLGGAGAGAYPGTKALAEKGFRPAQWLVNMNKPDLEKKLMEYYGKNNISQHQAGQLADELLKLSKAEQRRAIQVAGGGITTTGMPTPKLPKEFPSGSPAWRMSDTEFKEGAGWVDYPTSVEMPSTYSKILKNEGERTRDLVYELNEKGIKHKTIDINKHSKYEKKDKDKRDTEYSRLTIPTDQGHK